MNAKMISNGMFLIMVALPLFSCAADMGVNISVEKSEVLLGEVITLKAFVDSDDYYGQNRSSGNSYTYDFFWSIKTPICGGLSYVTGQRTYWTAPTEGSFPRTCSVSVKVRAINSKGRQIDSASDTVHITVRSLPVNN